MAVNILRRAAATLVVLIAALLGVLILQFSGSSEFILTAGAFKINGFERPDAAGEKSPEAPLYVSADGITFFIDRKSPLAAVLDTGETVALEMVSYIKEENSFTVRFDRDVSLSFLAARAESGGEEEGDVAIVAALPEGVAGLSIAYALDPRASLESLNGALIVSAESGFYRLEGAEAAASSADGAASNEHRLAISAASPRLSYARYEILEEVSLEAIAQDPSASEELYGQALENFAQSILQAYQAAAEANAVTDALAATFLAESARRGNLDAARASLPSSFLNGGERSYDTSPYIGGVEAAWRKWRAENEREFASYTANFDARSPAIFEKKSLVAFLISNRRADDYRRLAELAAQCASRASLTPRQAAGVLEFSADRRLLPRSVPEVDSETIAICEETLLGSLRYFSHLSSANSALYIEESEKSAGTTSALEIAAILYRWDTANEEKSEWAAAARLITATALGLAGEDGTLPAAIAIPERRGQKISQPSSAEDAAIPPAAVYPLIEPLASYFPHTVAVYPRYSIWTCASDAALYFPRAGVLDIAVEFPTGQAHYVVIRGVHDFYGIQVRGTTYNSDTRFEAASAPSCRYIAGEDTLFIKVQQREERETIRIFYNNPNL